MIPVHGLHLATAAPLCILNQQYGLFGADLAYQWCRAIQTGSHKLLFKGHSPKPFPYLPSFPFTYLLRLTGMEKGVNEKKLYTRMKIPGEISMLKSYNERVQKFSGGIPMKKFSFVFVACICLTTLFVAGCGNGDDPIGPGTSNTVTTNQVAFTQNYVIPGPTIALTSIRQATYWRDFSLRINGVDYPPSTYSIDNSGSTPMVTLVFALALDKTVLGKSWNDSTKTLSDIQLVEGGQPIVTVTSMTGNDRALTSAGSPTPTTVTFTLSLDPATLGLVVTVTSGTAQAATLIPTGNDTLFLEAVYYTKNGQLATLTASVADVPAPLATFTLYFNTIVTNATDSWKCTVTNMDKPSATFHLNSGPNSGLFSVSSVTSGGRSVVTVNVIGDSTKRLRTNTNYKVALTSSSIRRADKPSVTFGSLTRTFKTGFSQ